MNLILLLVVVVAAGAVLSVQAASMVAWDRPWVYCGAAW